MPSEYSLLFTSTVLEVVVVLLVGFEVIVGEIRHRARASMMPREAGNEGGFLLRRRLTMRLGLFIISISAIIWAFIYLTYSAAPVPHQMSSAPSAAEVNSKALNIDGATKWQFSSTLRNTTVASDGHRLTCPFTLNLSFQENGGGSYAPSVWEFWKEFQPMLDLAWWTATSGRTQSRRHFQPGITILVGSDKGDAFTCATNLARQLQDLHISKTTLRTNQTTEDLADCHNECVELDIGDRDVP